MNPKMNPKTNSKKERFVTVEAQHLGETVLVIWDPLYEKVMAVHRSEKGALKKLDKLNEEYDRYDHRCYRMEYDEFPLED